MRYLSTKGSAPSLEWSTFRAQAYQRGIIEPPAFPESREHERLVVPRRDKVRLLLAAG